MKLANGPRLKILHCRTDQLINNALAEKDLTSAQGRILAFLAHREEPPCPKDIEETFRLSHPTVSGLLSRMEKKEFIAIRPDEQDKRCKRIFLLPKGIACNDGMRAVFASIEEQLVKDFSPEEQAVFADLLNRAIQNMGGKAFPCNKEEKPL